MLVSLVVISVSYFMNSDNTFISELEKLGLSLKEALVYKCLLEMGRGTVSDIAHRARVKRTTGYVILDNLVSKKLAAVSGKEPKQEYVAEDPAQLIANISDELNNKEAQLLAAQNLVPQLKSIRLVGDRPKVRFFEGKEGLIQAYEDTLSSSEPISAFATIEDMHKALPGYFPLYYKRRAKKGINIRGIIPYTNISTERAKFNSEEKREIAFVPADEYYFSPEIDIYDNKVMIASWRERLGIIIESQEIADAMKKIYKLAWAEATRLNKELLQTRPETKDNSTTDYLTQT